MTIPFKRSAKPDSDPHEDSMQNELRAIRTEGNERGKASSETSFLDRWLPMLVGIIGAVVVNAIIVGIAYGRIVTTQEAEEKARLDKDTVIAQSVMPIEKQVEYFVTRKEWELRNSTRDTEVRSDKEAAIENIREVKKTLEATNQKIDLLLMRSIPKKE
jgi:hypothetical protein